MKICEFCGDEEKTETCAGCLTHLRICEKKMFEMYCTLGGIGLALESGATIENIGEIMDGCKVYGPLRANERARKKALSDTL